MFETLFKKRVSLPFLGSAGIHLTAVFIAGAGLLSPPPPQPVKKTYKFKMIERKPLPKIKPVKPYEKK